MGRRTRESTSEQEVSPPSAAGTLPAAPDQAPSSPDLAASAGPAQTPDRPVGSTRPEQAQLRHRVRPKRRRTRVAKARRRQAGWRRTKAWRLIATTVRSCMRYRVTGLAAEAAYFGVLSLPPLVFGMAGTIGYVVGVFGDQTVGSVKAQIVALARTALTEDSVQGVIVPTLNAVFAKGRADVVSIGFVLALWSGSRALNVFIDTVSIMYGMGGKRGIVKTRALSFSTYTVGLFIGVTVLPLVLAGPELVRDALPDRVAVLAQLYWPVVVTLSMLLMTSIYHFAVPVRYPWRYGLPGAILVFGIWILGSVGLRTVLSASIGGQSTSIYGPLAAPIVVLLWLYIIAIAVLIGAALNSAIATVWPIGDRAVAQPNPRVDRVPGAPTTADAADADAAQTVGEPPPARPRPADDTPDGSPP